MFPRRTKILCTIGPATSGKDNLIKLINAGMDAARLNFSHGSHEDHNRMIHDIREASKETGKPIPIVQDLQGPKIRTGLVENGAVLLEDGADFVITMDDMEYGNSQRVSTPYKDLIKEVKVGKDVLLDDGYIILKVKKINHKDIITEVIKGGELKNNKGIIAPGTESMAPSLNDKDLEDLKFGLDAGIDVIALSFVRSVRDILELKTAMKIFGRVVPIIAKIERYEGYQDLDAIIKEVAAVMVARGDLGLEMPTEQVPIIQKNIIKRCNYHGKPVITATQMLESMISNPRPTRAEASDVANAVIDGTDMVMLSGETSIGRYPFDAVDYMHRIVKEVEHNILKKNDNYEIPEKPNENISDAIGKASCAIAEQINAAAIVTFTRSTFTAKNIAKFRPKNPIIGITNDEYIHRRLAFVWGTTSVYSPEDDSAQDIVNHLDELVEHFDFLKSGDFIVFIAGLSSGNDLLDENVIKVYQV